MFIHFSLLSPGREFTTVNVDGHVLVRIICLSIITQSMGGGLEAWPSEGTPIWNMVGESFSLVVIATLTVHLFGFFLPTPPSFLPLFKFQMSCWTVSMLNISIQKDISRPQAFLLHRSLPGNGWHFHPYVGETEGDWTSLLYFKLPLDSKKLWKAKAGQQNPDFEIFEILSILSLWLTWLYNELHFFTILLVCVCDHTFNFIWR